MTRLTTPVRREVSIDGTSYIVTLTPHALLLRRKRSRFTLTLPLAVALTRAAILAGESLRRQRAADRQQRRLSKEV